MESVSTFVSLTAVSGTPAPSGLPPAIMFNVIVGASIYINNPLLTKYWSMEATSYGDSENQIGNNNVFLGAYPGLLTTGSGNTGMGAGVMPFMTTVHLDFSGGGAGGCCCACCFFANTGFGDSALFSVGTAVSNSAFGYTALQSATGSQNTAIGTGALQNVSTGGNNVGIGYAAGGGITIGSNNVVIGGVTGLASGLSDSIIIGDGAGNIKIDYSKTNAGAWTVVGELITAPSATGSAGLRLTSGTAPTSPVDGDMWYDGTNVKFRVGGTTKTFTLT